MTLTRQKKRITKYISFITKKTLLVYQILII